MDELTDKLVENAKNYLRMMYSPPEHTVAAAALTDKGEIVAAINSHHFTGFVCAEMALLSQTLNIENPLKVKKPVSVKCLIEPYDQDKVEIINSCGKCRQIWLDYDPEVQMIVDKDGEITELGVKELLPYAYRKVEQ